MEFCTLAKLKVLNTNCSKILDLNSKFKQIGFEIKIWSYLLENVCTTQFEGISNVKWNDVERIHYLCTLLVPWNHQKIKDSISDVWQGSEYANEYGCKILAKWLLMSTVKHRNKGLYRYENIHVFIAFSFLCFIFQAPRQFFFSFSSLYFIIHVIGTAIVKDVVSF